MFSVILSCPSIYEPKNVKEVLGNLNSSTIYSWTGDHYQHCKCTCDGGGNGGGNGGNRMDLNFAMFGNLAILYLLKIKENY